LTTSSKLPDIPEFPSWTILPLVIAGIIAIEVYRKKLHDKMSANQNQAYFTGKLGWGPTPAPYSNQKEQQ